MAKKLVFAFVISINVIFFVACNPKDRPKPEVQKPDPSAAAAAAATSTPVASPISALDPKPKPQPEIQPKTGEKEKDNDAGNTGGSQDGRVKPGSLNPVPVLPPPVKAQGWQGPNPEAGKEQAKGAEKPKVITSQPDSSGNQSKVTRIDFEDRPQSSSKVPLDQSKSETKENPNSNPDSKQKNSDGKDGVDTQVGQEKPEVKKEVKVFKTEKPGLIDPKINGEFGGYKAHPEDIAAVHKYNPGSPLNVTEDSAAPFKRYTGGIYEAEDFINEAAPSVHREKPVTPGAAVEPQRAVEDAKPVEKPKVVVADDAKRFKNPDNYTYTDAAYDFLMPFFRWRLKNIKDQEVKNNNLAFARNIQDVEYYNQKDGLAVVKVKVVQPDDSGNSIYDEITLKGRYSDDESYARLNQVKSQDGANQNKDGSYYTGELRCEDLDEASCDTVFIRIVNEREELETPLVANVVIRDTGTAIRTEKINTEDPNYSDNYRKFARMSLNTTEKKHDGDYIKEFRITTVAVSEGFSKVSVKFIINTGEVIVLSSPLVAPSSADNKVSNVVMSTKTTLADVADIEGYRKSERKYQDSIQQAQLIANNGLGKFKISLKFIGDLNSKNEDEEIIYSFMRDLKPIRDIDTEESIYFKPDQRK